MRQVAAIALQSSVHGAVGFVVELGNCALTTICEIRQHFQRITRIRERQ